MKIPRPFQVVIATGLTCAFILVSVWILLTMLGGDPGVATINNIKCTCVEEGK